MNKVLKKSVVIISVILFLISAMGSTHAMRISKNAEISKESFQKTMTIHRVGPDGSITPVEVNVAGEKEDIGKYLESKCSELFEEDIEMQTLVQKLQKKEVEDKNLSDNFGLFRVKSSGRGFHIKTKLGLNFFKSQFMLLRVILATFLISPKKGLVIGIYNDEKASTTFHPIGNPDSVTNITGNHIIIVGGFIGYTTWTGRFSCLLSSILLPKDSILRRPRTFSGIAALVFYKQS